RDRLVDGAELVAEDLDALPAHQPVGLDDEGSELAQVALDLVRRIVPRERPVLDVARDAVLHEEAPRERLARLDARQRARRPHARRAAEATLDRVADAVRHP